jgi:hypothetical protein
VLARFRIQAGVRQPKALDRFAADDVGFNDFIDIGFGDKSVPDGIGINHQIRAVLTLVETASLIGTHFAFKAAFRQFLLEEFLQLRLASGVAASPRISRRALVAAYEDVFLKLRHEM